MTTSSPAHPPADTAKAARTVPPEALARFQAEAPSMLAAAGFAPAAAEALTALDTALFFWHRFAAKGEFARVLIAEAGGDIDLSQFHALTAISRIEHGVERAAAEPATVGLVAEEMAIDPSRASRITSGLIEAGYLRREAAQDDGRKAVLVLTDKAREVFHQFRVRKWQKLIAVFEHWSEEDIQCFSRLFARYSEDVRKVYHGGE